MIAVASSILVAMEFHKLIRCGAQPSARRSHARGVA
jgi:hypothetical protein